MKQLTFLVGVLAVALGLVVHGQSHRQLLGITPAPGTGVPEAEAFFDDTVLHEIRLDINAKDWQSLKDHYLDNTYYPCDFHWQDHTVRNVGIRSRGGGSRSGIKPGLRVDFNRYTTDQTFLGLKSFVLRNNTQEASNMNERLSMLLFRRLGLPASREAHTKFYVNGTYGGVFTIVESIDKDFLQRNLGENDGVLYKYEYEVDSKPYYFEDRGSDPASYIPLPFKLETDKGDPNPEFIPQLVQAINIGAAFRTAIAEYVDLPKFFRFLAASMFLADNDGFLSDYGGMNNFYLYRFQGKKLFTFIVWDKSNSFSSPTWSIWHNITDVPSFRQNQLVNHALASRDLYDSYLNSLMDAVKSTNEVQAGSTDTRGWLEREIEKEYKQIRDATLADPDKPFTNDAFERAVVDLTNFARSRGDFITKEVTAARAQP